MSAAYFHETPKPLSESHPMLFSRFTRSIKTILIVEDEPLVAFDNELRVVDAGYRVVATVDTQDEAIAVLEREEIDLVLADVNLSRGGSGIEVARVASERDIPVLFATGTCPGGAQQYAIGCLNKPYSAAELVGAIDAVDRLIRGKKPRTMPRHLSLFASP
ncbi:response regulator [Blastomonas fulva]|uniref:response regulator n=1 Tax=Blastomonas fulva TaxID=1550728 RepID=UPI0032B0601F